MTLSGLVMAGATGVTMVIVSVLLPVPTAFVAPKVTGVTAAVVGVPVMSPVAVTAKPAGRAGAVKLVGLLLAVI